MNEKERVKLAIGQILYFIPAGKLMLYPLQVVEEVTKKTLKGIEVDYSLRMGNEKVVHYCDLKGEVFESTEKARSIMLERASMQIDNMLQKAIKSAKEWYENVPDVISDDMPKLVDPSIDREGSVTVVELPDGTKARLKMPSDDS